MIFVDPAFTMVFFYAWSVLTPGRQAQRDSRTLMQCNFPRRIGKEDNSMLVPCGKCAGCRIAHSREWATRILHEVGYHESSVFATLTYSDDNLPADGNLDKDELVRFFKRLRKALGVRRIKYYASGEYGERFGRPHYHAIIFGLGLSDQIVIEKAWPFGFVDLGTVTYDSARYTADYIIQKVGKYRVSCTMAPPFQIQSCGIGKQFCLDNRQYFETKLGCTVHGHEVGIPRYYKKKLEIPKEVLYKKRLEADKIIWTFYSKKKVTEEQLFPCIQAARKQNELNITAKFKMRRNQRF